MKYLKIFEDNKFIIWRNSIDSYNLLIKELLPIVFWKYKKLADDENYEPEWGTIPDQDRINGIEDLDIIGCENLRDGSIEFRLTDYGNEGDILNSYYINLKDKEIEEYKISKETNKFNL